MSEALFSTGPAVDMADPLSADLVSADLSTRVAGVAVAVAGVLEERCSAASGAVEAAGFLREWAASITAVERVPGTPLDLLTERWRLTDQETSLVLLAGLPEEHEGLAATL